MKTVGQNIQVIKNLLDEVETMAETRKVDSSELVIEWIDKNIAYLIREIEQLQNSPVRTKSYASLADRVARHLGLIHRGIELWKTNGVLPEKWSSTRSEQ